MLDPGGVHRGFDVAGVSSQAYLVLSGQPGLRWRH